jgi:hypothetical protein
MIAVGRGHLGFVGDLTVFATTMGPAPHCLAGCVRDAGSGHSPGFPPSIAGELCTLQLEDRKVIEVVEDLVELCPLVGPETLCFSLCDQVVNLTLDQAGQLWDARFCAVLRPPNQALSH